MENIGLIPDVSDLIFLDLEELEELYLLQCVEEVCNDA